MTIARKISASLPKPDICALMIDALTKTDRLRTAMPRAARRQWLHSPQRAGGESAVMPYRQRRHRLLCGETLAGTSVHGGRIFNGLEDSQGEPASRRRKRDFLASWVCMLTGSIVAKGIAWLFYAETVTSAAVLELWTMTFSNDIVFSIWLVFGIARNAFRPMMAKLMVALIMVGLLCNWIMAYAVTYRYFGIIDSEKEARDSITCLYFSIVTWTTLGYGDVRPSLDARLIAASEALIGYVWMAAFIGLLAELLRQLAREITSGSPNHVE
jgi:hypothetical protein